MERFDSFVVFAEMRTGSNFLEANLNEFDGLKCHGEAFNPHFIGYPDRDQLLGMSRKDRETDPFALLAKLRDAPGLNGFRYFNNHDPRILDTLLEDERCAKVILTRNPVDSYVSWKIARATDQWKLTNVTHVKKQRAAFDAEEFLDHVTKLQAFQVSLLNALQVRGQTAFHIAYEDLQSVDVMNGLAQFLGVEDRIKSLNKKLKKQNPEPLQDKVADFDGMERAIARLDRFNLNRTPNFEPRRGPLIPSFVAAPTCPLLFLPMRTGPNHAIRRWLAGVDGQRPAALREDFTQKTLREWLRENPGHRSFTVLRHPLARAHAAFCERILSTGKGAFPEIRATLQRVHELPLPDDENGEGYGPSQHRDAFLGFLTFLKSNLSGQTAVRVDGSWASQSALLQGMAEFMVPDMILRENDMRNQLALLASQVGKTHMPKVPTDTDPLSARLSDIYDAELENAAYDAYSKDYDLFGFGRWQD